MLLEADATRAVSDLIQRGVCSLPAVGAVDLTQAVVAHEARAAIESIEAAAPIRERMRNGRLPQVSVSHVEREGGRSHRRYPYPLHGGNVHERTATVCPGAFRTRE